MIKYKKNEKNISKHGTFLGIDAKSELLKNEKRIAAQKN